MKKSVAILCTLLMLFSFKTIVQAEENVIQVRTDSTNCSMGDTIKVEVKAKDVKDLYSTDLTVKYDPQYLELVNSKFSTLNELGRSEGKGTSRYLLSILGKDEGINGEVNIAELEFKTLKKGITKINFPSTILVNSKGEKRENIKLNTETIEIKEKVNVESIKLNTEKYRLKVGDNYKLIQTVLPENASNKNVNWTSNDPSVVEVKDGYIKGLKEGNAVITVTTEDGKKTAKCNVEVYKEGDNSGNNGGENLDNESSEDNMSGGNELPQTGDIGGIRYLSIIGFGMLVLGTIIKKVN